MKIEIDKIKQKKKNANDILENPRKNKIMIFMNFDRNWVISVQHMVKR